MPTRLKQSSRTTKRDKSAAAKKVPEAHPNRKPSKSKAVGGLIDRQPGVQARDGSSRLAQQLLKRVESLRARVLKGAAGWAKAIERIDPKRRASAMNLAHYLALRRTDIRDLQPRLASLGLSRLGRSEAHTLSSLNALLGALSALSGNSIQVCLEGPVSISEGASLLGEHARELLGASSPGRHSRIMVTMPSEAATQPELLRELLGAGMNVMRINCAHDNINAWLGMIENLRAAERATGRACRVYADLAGPKLRTGKLKPFGRLLNFGPVRDLRGRILRPSQIWLTSHIQPELAPLGTDAVVPITEELLAAARVGDEICFDDSRGIRRKVVLVESVGPSWLAQGMQRVYLEDGAQCALYRDMNRIGVGRVGPLEEVVLPLVLHKGDFLLVVPENQLGDLGQSSSKGCQGSPPSIPCTLDEAFVAVRPGHAIWFDDGKLGGIVRAAEPERMLVEITHAPSRGAKLRPEKGINLPDTDLAVPALSEKDLADLSALAPHIDLVGLSFVRQAEDVFALHAALARLNADRLGTVLKIETRAGFENLPAILMAGLARAPFGIMVARGDLAVEIGFERLAEVQEEILWLCEAAHVPVIWATQVLESMAKRGQPSRAEVSDAAFSVRSECVMLNKGPYIVETATFLSGVLARMSGHHSKRRPMMRRLAVAGTR